MTELATPLVVAVIAVPLISAGAVGLMPSLHAADRLNTVAALLTAGLALTLAGIALASAPDVAARQSWYVLDAAGGVFLALIAVVGLASALTSASYLRHAGQGFFSARRARASYYAAFNLFWAALLATPLADNLGVAWLLIEATTATSALLVAFSGKRSALEAGWKYVVLTTLGLTVTLLGIVVLFAAVGGVATLRNLDWQLLASRGPDLPPETTLVAFVLILVGLAAKIGWAPVHNWLPDAHSEAPPPISAMLSAALLPTVLLIAWRTELALEPAIGLEHGPDVAGRFRPRFSRGRGSIPVETAAMEAVARLFEPRAHGDPRPRHRLRHAVGDRRGGHPRHRSRACKGAGLLRRNPIAARGSGNQ